MTRDERQAALEAIAAEVRGVHAVPAPRDAHARRSRARATPTPRSCSSARGRASTRTARAGRSSAAPAACSCELLGHVGWRREDVFITNVVKCRPPGNRDPEPDEIAACAPYLRRQLEVLDPALVVTLGRYSMGVHARRAHRPGPRHDRGRSTRRPGAAMRSVFAMYHPAAALRQRRRVERESFEDMRRASRRVLVDARERRDGAHAPRRRPPADAAPASARCPTVEAAVDPAADPPSPCAAEPAAATRPAHPLLTTDPSQTR